MKGYSFKLLIILFVIVIGTGCGGGSDTVTTDPDDEGSGSSSGSDSGNTVNTEKLIGTPFEGLTAGDSLDFDFFLCGKYRTNTIDTSFPTTPIKIFPAFFTENEEELIQEGVTFANTGMGFTAYEITDIWSDDIRVIYKVDDIHALTTGNPGASASNLSFSFNGKNVSETETPDWAIIIDAGTANSTGLPYTVAHELGHASGIQNHQLIDYVNDTRTDFNDADSIMDSPHGTETPDYYFMMSMQGQIMQDHVGEEGTEQQKGPTESECEAEGLGD